eukprot:6155018-Pyramimonas_sp.AAC.1
MQPTVLARTTSDGITFKCEVYVHAIHKRASISTSMWLALPYVATFIFGDDYDKTDSNFVS